MHKLFMLMGAAALITGCATQGTHPESVTSYSTDEAQSYALNVATAAGLKGPEDIPRDDYEAMVDENPELRGMDPMLVGTDGSAGSLLGASAAGVAGAMDPVIGMGDLASGALGVISWLAETPEVEKQNWVMFWLPEGKTLRDFEDVFAKAQIHAMDFEMSEMESYPASTVRDREYTGWALRGCEVDGDPRARECAVGILFSYFQMTPHSDSVHADDFDLSSVPTSTPDFIDSAGNEFVGPITASMEGISASNPDVYFTPEYYKRLSEALPDWVFIYHTSYGSRNYVPRILNKGQSHYFVEPAG